LLITATLTLSAQQSEQQIKKEIGQFAASMKTLQCDFVQTKHLKMLNDKMVSRGKMYYSQSNRLRWEYVTPYTYTFILNNDKVLLKNKKRSDVIDVRQNKVFREIARMMMNSVVGDCLNDSKSFKNSISDRGGEWIATLVPLRKEMKQLFQTIFLHFNKKQGVVTSVEMVEKNGDRTIIELKNIKKNETIANNIFDFH
jgi:outer membrane lipoprotein carrier protein